MLTVLREGKVQSQSEDHNISVIEADVNYLTLSKPIHCKSVKRKACKISDFIQYISERGCIVSPIVEPTSRNHRKIASIQRSSDKTIGDTSIRASRFKLNQIN